MKLINPYYNPEALELEMLTFDEPNMSYEYNTLCFWATKDGRVYSASDAGCSCPTPFEDYEGPTLDKVLQLLERVGSVSQAEAIFDSWNSSVKLPMSDRQQLSDWVKTHLTS